MAESKRTKIQLSEHNIPPELWFVILPYLPSKSLLRFRSVSKTWKFIIDDDDFVSAHLTHCPNNLNQSYLLWKDPWCWKRRLYVCHSDTLQKTMKLSVPIDRREKGHKRQRRKRNYHSWQVVGTTVNGLVILQRSPGELRGDDDVIVWNPSIRKGLNLPPPPSCSSWLKYDPVSGYSLKMSIGFDSVSNEYKVVVFDQHGPATAPLIHIFSLKTHLWRTSECGFANRRLWYEFVIGNRQFHSGFACGNTQTVCCGGYIHWIDQEEYFFGDVWSPSCLFSFDFHSELLLYAQLPVELQVPIDMSEYGAMCPFAVLAVGSSIGLLSNSSLWVLESPPGGGEGDSAGANWSKRNHDIFLDYRQFEFVFVKRDGRVLIWGNSKSAYSYDLETRVLEVVSNHQVGYGFLDTYIESMVLLKGEKNLLCV